jgi:diacylglycerol kinase (ATP)
MRERERKKEQPGRQDVDMDGETSQKSNATSESIQPRSAIIIANPTAGTYQQHRQQIEETLTDLREHGWEIELKLTENAGDARRLAQEAVAQKLDVVIAVGGDGTINEIIQELARSKTALGVLPSGTVNVWAREVGIPLDNQGAREVLLTGQTRRIDLGQVNDERYFLLMASIGFDAEVTQTIEHKPIKRFGVLGYIFLGTWLGLGYPNFVVSLQTPGRLIRARALQVIFGNTQLYAGAVRFTWQASCDDGLLDISLVHSQSAFGRVRLYLDFLLGQKWQRKRWVRYESTTEVKLHTNIPVALQVDGDPLGYTSQKRTEPTVIRVVPDALKVIVPQEVSEDLFSQR